MRRITGIIVVVNGMLSTNALAMAATTWISTLLTIVRDPTGTDSITLES